MQQAAPQQAPPQQGAPGGNSVQVGVPQGRGAAPGRGGRQNGPPAKPSRDVRIGDRLKITNDSGIFTVEVLLLSDIRGSAAMAQTLYQETEASREQRMKVAAERKAMREFEQLPAGRPDKRDRRRIIQFRGRS